MSRKPHESEMFLSGKKNMSTPDEAKTPHCWNDNNKNTVCFLKSAPSIGHTKPQSCKKILGNHAIKSFPSSVFASRCWLVMIFGGVILANYLLILRFLSGSILPTVSNFSDEEQICSFHGSPNITYTVIHIHQSNNVSRTILKCSAYWIGPYILPRLGKWSQHCKLVGLSTYCKQFPYHLKSCINKNVNIYTYHFIS